MGSVSNTLVENNNELNLLLSEASRYVSEAAQTGIAAHDVEKQVFDYVLKMGHQMLVTFFQLQGDGNLGETLTLSDGQKVKRLDARTRTYRSLLGDFRLNRYGYGVRDKQAVVCYPLDTRLQLPEEEHSYPVQELFHLLTTEVSYITAREILGKLLKINATVDSMERINQRCGEAVDAFRETLQMPDPAQEGELFVLTADGKGVPIRHAKDAARISDQQAKSGPRPDRKRMAVVGAAYTIKPFLRTPLDILEALFCEPDNALCQDKPKRPFPQNKQVVANLTRQTNDVELKASQLTFDWLAQQVKGRGENNPILELVQSGDSDPQPASTKIHLAMMDGQESLWNQVKQLKETYPERKWVEILDLMHANSYLWEAACAFHPGDNKQQLIFMKDRVLRVLSGDVMTVISGFRQMATKRRLNKTLQAVVVKVCRYFENNQHRMKYNEYLAAGYPIATGVIEGACRHYVKDRMERAGMRWTIKGAQAMLNMRSVNLNGNFDEFNQYRIQQQAKKLYPHANTIAAIGWPIAA
ncbi:hypothetical protein COX64_03265 [Candidatus Dojkabacteria bacterium CG_4_10_14_0_2_um_filter_Dojkabacteria_WS6_41_15]|uniref:ISKra4 family transposase n=1 Tax=Candidatus Dojkabacteria bacterium CG_4_10_14_0_2_um_filter_Dojkabacteria_WS6_41_15 TaxID=2014249 RepID=A0A2M7W1J6_9BACT|nr:MAG: hypothetical protein COX64_03265 [Candidatus Dojkabacteria bacterium CG_4_10_14_0_2_um_filter_Dojkabacteria_WS6_41_15]